MVRLRVAEILKARGITTYALAKGAGLNFPTAYRLANATGKFHRLEATTLDRVCAFLNVQPGELIEWVPDARRSRR